MTFMTGGSPGISTRPSHQPAIRFGGATKGEGPRRGRWVVWTYVFEGGYRGQVRGYIDGKKIFEGLGRNLCTLPGGRMTVGGEFATRLGESTLFQGGIARIRAWNHAQGDEEIRKRAKAFTVDKVNAVKKAGSEE